MSMAVASKAMSEMHGKVIGQKPLFVAVAERKEERIARLQAQFSQFQTLGGIVGYHSGVPSITPQQFYFGQHTPDLMALQPTGNGFQQQFMSGGVGSSIATNFIMPYHHQRKSHPKHRMTGRRVGNFQHVQQNQLLPRNSNQRVRYNGRNGNDPSVVDPKGLVGQMMVPPVVVAPPTDNQLHGALSNKSLSSTLASSPPEIQHMFFNNIFNQTIQTRSLETGNPPSIFNPSPTNIFNNITVQYLRLHHRPSCIPPLRCRSP
ncbi:hypothetical protein TSUD_288990 [Trifolium subterraneum]|uniref:RRM domain-containing protein n=1 Tax=Trifolium subterraneum TaxID=3900 RepID=A0A2Z6M2J6_TRISU|nr:hypothetical protein TSUD_288990 [Trifolium subterraneum]